MTSDLDWVDVITSNTSLCALLLRLSQNHWKGVEQTSVGKGGYVYLSQKPSYHQ